MPVTLEELQGSKQQELFTILFLNSEWLMSTWSDHNEMATRAVKIQASHLQTASITVKKRECKSKDKNWVVASARIQCRDFTLILDLPETFLQQEEESAEDHERRLASIKLALENKIFAPRGPVAGKAV